LTRQSADLFELLLDASFVAQFGPFGVLGQNDPLHFEKFSAKLSYVP
jgi:hypothetical protein